MSTYVTNSKAETVSLGEKLAATLHAGDLILFTGGLGAGKTAFCEGIAAGLHCIDAVSSPTFAIVNAYRGTQIFAHFDLYRISTMEDLQSAGFFDYLEDGAIVAAEWSENVTALLKDEPHISIDIAQTGENTRRITICGGAL
ncbi:MAG: tRNA (adenosine(37)-N6)-threonylcarbamoyltransferase complex ATPase subunit type 1 TsaE [Ruthenibacterium sp.]